jgi:hypothetical protein
MLRFLRAFISIWLFLSLASAGCDSSVIGVKKEKIEFPDFFIIFILLQTSFINFKPKS